MSDVTADVLVIGAGVIGAAVAYELARRDAEVVVIDSGPEPATGCSFANAGLLSPGHVEPLTTPANMATGLKCLPRRDSPFHITADVRNVPWLARFAASSTPRRARALTALMRQLARDSLALHEKYDASGLDTGFRRTGSLDVFVTGRGFAAASPGDGDVLSGAQARELEPGLGDIAGAVRHAEDAVSDTRMFARACLDAAREYGARVLWDTGVDEIRAAGGRVDEVSTARGTIRAGSVVVAAGLLSGRLTRPLGIRLPLLGGKGYVLDVPFADQPAMPVTFKELKVVATPYPDRIRLCGTMDLGESSSGLIPSRVRAIRDAARRGLPRLDTSRPSLVWAGQRPCTADGIPVIGRSSRITNLLVAAGHGMWGLVLSPVTATTIAEAVVARETDPALAPFSPDRFLRRGRR